MVDNKSSELSPMTKAIMQEIRGHSNKCNACQPHKCPDPEEIASKMESDSDNFLGKFYLQKFTNKKNYLIFFSNLQE